ncbi:MAG: hypothetical protein K1X78_27005 [Verrucomicrobiaceae bacterium]|nr:hypothetical protein [Verrucomicrobiaceae bacterium]
MNHDDHFENKLQSLTRELRRPDATAQWKEEILARALREAATAKVRVLPPRWLMGAWAGAWAAVLVLKVAVPQPSIQPASSPFTVTSAAKPEPTTETLLAYNRRLTLNIDLP